MNSELLANLREQLECVLEDIDAGEHIEGMANDLRVIASELEKLIKRGEAKCGKH